MQLLLINVFADAKFVTLVAKFLQWISLRVVHGGSERLGRGVESLNLVWLEIMVFQPQAQVKHVLFIASRVGGDEIGNQVLLLAGFL